MNASSLSYALLLAARPKTLPASLSPVILGTALVPPHMLNWLLALCALGCALFLQITVNLANDYFDAKSGVDTAQRLGPTRVTQSKIASTRFVVISIGVFMGLSIACGLILVAHSNIVLLGVGLLCVLAALGYSGGPYPLASHGLGEFAVLLFFGWIAVLGSYYIHTQALTLQGFLLATALGLVLSAIMLVNNIRDIPTDKPAGKNTLAVMLGDTCSRKLYKILIAAVYPLHLCAFTLFEANPITAIALAPLFIYSPFAFIVCRRINKLHGSQLNSLLAETARLGLIYSASTSIVLVI